MTEEFIEESTEDNTLASTSSAEGEQGSRSGDTASQQDKDHKTKQTRKKQNNAFNAALQSTAQRYAALNKSVQQMQMQLTQMNEQFNFITAEAAVAIEGLEITQAGAAELLATQQAELTTLQQDLADENYSQYSKEELLVQIELKETEINNTIFAYNGTGQVIEETKAALESAGIKLRTANERIEILDQQIKDANGDPELIESLEAERDAAQELVNEAQGEILVAEKYANFASTMNIFIPTLQMQSDDCGDIAHEQGKIALINARTELGNAILSATKDLNISAQEFENIKALAVEAGIEPAEIDKLASDINANGITMTGADGTIYSGTDAGDYLASKLEEQIQQSQSDLNQLVTDLENSGNTEDAQIVKDVVEIKDYIVVNYNDKELIVYRDENNDSHIYVMDGDERVYVNQMEEPYRTNAFLEFNGGMKDGKPYDGQSGQKTGEQDPAQAKKLEISYNKLRDPDHTELREKFRAADNHQYGAHQKLAQAKAEQENTTANTNLSLITNANDRGSSASSIDPDENQNTSLTAFAKAADPTTEPTPEEPVIVVQNDKTLQEPTNTGQIA